MAEQANQGTQPNDGGQTSAPTGATDDQNQGGATPNATSGVQQDEQVTLSKKDYQNLISQRDRNFDQARGSNDVVADLQETVADLSKRDYVSNWMKDNGSKFPDVSPEDLYAAGHPDDIEAIAKSAQGRADKIREDERKKLLTVGSQPELTAEQKADRLKEAEKNHDFSGFVDTKLPKAWR